MNPNAPEKGLSFYPVVLFHLYYFVQKSTFGSQKSGLRYDPMGD